MQYLTGLGTSTQSRFLIEGEIMLMRMNRWIRHLNQRSFLVVVRQTLLPLFPFALIGSVAQMILKTMFSDDGFFANIFYFTEWLPDGIYKTGQAALMAFNSVTIGLFGLLVVYGAAQKTAQRYSRDGQLAGFTGIITLLLVAFHYDSFSLTKGIANFSWNLLGGKSVLIALLIGYGVGQMYHWLGQPVEVTMKSLPQDVRRRSFAALKPLSITMVLAMLVSFTLNFSVLNSWFRQAYANIINVGENGSNLALTMLTKVLAGIADWLGLGTATSSGVAMNGSAFADNLNYALRHGSSWNVPHPLLGSSLYNSFANFGGHGVLLALLVAIIISSQRAEYHRVARWTLLPTLFNSSFGALIGIPVLMNPILALPVIFLPAVNMLIAALAITIHVIPATPYPVLVGTPGPLISFIATNGNWWVLVFTLALFIFDVWVFTKFVKILDHPELALEGEVRHEIN